MLTASQLSLQSVNPCIVCRTRGTSHSGHEQSQLEERSALQLCKTSDTICFTDCGTFTDAPGGGTLCTCPAEGLQGDHTQAQHIMALPGRKEGVSIVAQPLPIG